MSMSMTGFSPLYFPTNLVFHKDCLPQDAEYECWCDCGLYHYSVAFVNQMATPVPAVLENTTEVRRMQPYYAVRERPCTSLTLYLPQLQPIRTPTPPAVINQTPGIQLLIRTGRGSIVSNTALLNVQPPFISTMGLIAQIHAPPFTQWEIFVRAISGNGGVPVDDVNFAIGAIVSDHTNRGTTVEILPGSFTTVLATPAD